MKIHEEERKITVHTAISLACLVSALEEKNPDIIPKVNEEVGLVDVLFLPNRANPLWKEEIGQPVNPVPTPGVNDVMALSMIFAGIFSADLLSKFTYDQVYFYALFMLKSTKQRIEYGCLFFHC